MPVEYAKWEWEEEQTPRSILFNDVYHSRSGGIAQAREVFIEGSGFPARWQKESSCTILETGFGFGLNFLTTWNAWKESNSQSTLHYLAIERYPWKKEDLIQVWKDYPELSFESHALLEQWILPISGFHRLVFEQGRVVLTLALGDIHDVLPEWIAQIDAFYFDGFSPDKNPDMWSVHVFKKCARLARQGATIATYTVAGAVRKAMIESGFVVERVKGFGGKRQRLVGFYQGFNTSHKRHKLPFILAERLKYPKSIAVIGAGIAGCSVTERLVARGIAVHLFDVHEGSAQQTSGNRAGVIFPLISQDDNRSERITRAAYLWWQRQRDHWLAHGMIADFPGVLQLAKTHAQAELQQSTVLSRNLPAEYVAFMDSQMASQYVGYPVTMPGWWFSQGGWVNPSSMCQAMLNASRQHVQEHWNTRVVSIRPNTFGGWDVGTSDALIHVDQVVLANAWESAELLPENALMFKRIAGQTTDLGPGSVGQLRTVVCQDGYVIPTQAGYGCMGATFEWEDTPVMDMATAYMSNATRVQRMIPSVTLCDLVATGGRLGWRTCVRDRLPVMGSFYSMLGEYGSGLWGLLALGSRGLVWAPWLAEVLVSACCGEPIPIERCLWEALAPDRFDRR